MGTRRQAREAALQALYMCDFLGRCDLPQVEFCFDNFSVGKAAREYALKLCQGVYQNLLKVDSKLASASENWCISRMGRVDRSILRMAAYELIFCPEVPARVAINESIEIAKAFGLGESPAFINGVLDKVAQGQRSILKPEIIRVESETSLPDLASGHPAAPSEQKKI